MKGKELYASVDQAGLEPLQDNTHASRFEGGAGPL